MFPIKPAMFPEPHPQIGAESKVALNMLGLILVLALTGGLGEALKCYQCEVQ